MKNQAYIHEDYPKACGFCERGSLSFDGTAILCCRKGIMDPEDCCRRFVYDPLKRIPKRLSLPSDDYCPEDFTL